ncbi:MAG: DUF2877 domain-containing protein [Chloroflexota bacterium]
MPRIDFDAVAHSVFQSAINLRLDNAGSLITLVASSEADLPQGIRVDAPNDFSFEIFRAGQEATCRNDFLRLDSLTIDLRGARRWKCDLPSLRVDPTNPTFSAAWISVWKALNQRQMESNAEIIAENLFHADGITPSIVAERTAKALRELLEATRRYDLTLAASSIRALIGLGSGLTPSGDDLLVGYLAGLWCAVGSQSERARFVSELGEVIIQRSSQTNEISRAFLSHAAQGQVSSLLANLAEAICMGWNPDRVLAAAECAMQVGHTSGMDAVTGLLVGLAAWKSMQLPFICP